MPHVPGGTAIESPSFPIAFISQLAEKESWRKEVHRPVMHMHKWWAKRLGSVFRAIILGAANDDRSDLAHVFYQRCGRRDLVVFDPFMGSGTTLVEAHKLGMIALGMDINPVAVRAVKTALGPMDRGVLERTMANLEQGVGKRIRALYETTDGYGQPATTLYYFWVMQAPCPACATQVDLFSNYVVASNAYPKRRPETQVLAPCCGEIFESRYGRTEEMCPKCRNRFNPQAGPVSRTQATCPQCSTSFKVVDVMDALATRPPFRLYGKLVLRRNGEKQYLAATQADREAYDDCVALLAKEEESGNLSLPALALEDGYNTRQALRYNFRTWRDFFNARQLLALAWLRDEIGCIDDAATRRVFATLHSGTLEFNNMFASYKGEGTGAIRHMFAHHILKPERTPIEGNIWGTSKSSGSFSGLFKTRVLRAIDYREKPREVTLDNSHLVCSEPFEGLLVDWPMDGAAPRRGVSVRCGDSASSGLADGFVDLVITDPPFFDNVHYSELADFFQAWHTTENHLPVETTRSPHEVQDSDKVKFTNKLEKVFVECNRVLRDDGIMAFTYHHSRPDGWDAVGQSVLESGFIVTTSQPLKAEMSVATPKSTTREPIQLDNVLVCRKAVSQTTPQRSIQEAANLAAHQEKVLEDAGFTLSRNDRAVIRYGQALTTVSQPHEIKSALQDVYNLVEAFSIQFKKTLAIPS